MTTTITIDWTLVIAVYAAVVASATLVWDWWKWLHVGPDLYVTAQADMKTFNMPQFDHKTVLVINVTNRGDRPTTITHFTVHGFSTWWKWFKKRPDFSAIVNVANDMRPPPHVLEPGGTWTVPCLQDEELVALSKNGGRLALGLSHSHSKKTIYRRVIPKPE